MKPYTVFLILTLCALSTLAAPRKMRPLEFPRSKEQPQSDATLAQDAVARSNQEATEAILRASDPETRLSQQPQGETFNEYQERLREARERIRNNPVSSEELKQDQLEALYETEYLLRRDTFGGSGGNMYGQGAGPWGLRYQAPLDLRRVLQMLQNSRKTPSTEQSSASEEPQETVIVLESNLDRDDEASESQP